MSRSENPFGPSAFGPGRTMGFDADGLRVCECVVVVDVDEEVWGWKVFLLPSGLRLEKEGDDIVK